MGPELLAYPFLFVAIFFESFILVTLLSTPARKARGRAPSRLTPKVAMIVPCFNEQHTLLNTVESLLALEYPKEKLSIIIVNDGSTDGTEKVMEAYRSHPQITLISKANGGKHTALNAGLAVAGEAELVGCLDADSFVHPGALKEMVACFSRPEVAAATAAMSVFNPKNLLERMQHAEYSFGIALRHALSTINGLYVTPGPFSLYRNSVLKKVGNFRFGYQTEDMEMALRLQQAGYVIENAPRANVLTKAPRTVSALVRQRTRWISGFLYNITREYRGLMGNTRQGALGLIVLPLACLAIVSGIVIFVASLATLLFRILGGVGIRAGIPVTYAYVPSFSFDWFYIPSAAYILLALIMLAGSLTMIAVGRRISRSTTPIAEGVLAYVFLYGFIAPLWLMRACFDVLIGKHRAWR